MKSLQRRKLPKILTRNCPNESTVRKLIENFEESVLVMELTLEHFAWSLENISVVSESGAEKH